MNKILIIIPCYNEELNIEKVVYELKVDFGIADVLCVNDCSKDNTLAVLKQIPSIRFLNLPINLGYSGALQTGFKYAFENDYDFVIQFDGDGQHIASEAKKIFDKLVKEDLDIVIGSRFKENSGYKHGFFRTVGTKIFILLIKLFAKRTITDPTSGFQVLRKNVFTRYSKIHNFPEYPDANLIIEMLLLGYKIDEVPVKMRLREFGVSMHGGFWNPIQYMIRMFFSIFMILISFSLKNRK
jgi:glycosyltransferase involved in cell wall biosynthesis